MGTTFIKCHPLQYGLPGGVYVQRSEGMGRASEERREVHFRKHLHLPFCLVRGLKPVIVGSGT